MEFLWLFGLFFTATLATAQVIVINDVVDKAMKAANEKLREMGVVGGTVHPFPLSPNVTFTKASCIGADSNIRTGNCTETTGPNSTTDLHFGLSFLELIFYDLRINGDLMSAALRIKDFSIAFSATVHKEPKKCWVSLDKFLCERLQNAEFGSSLPDYDGLDVDHYLQTTARSALNDVFKSVYPRVEQELQIICHSNSVQPFLPDLLQNFISYALV